jgi:hypothetical protein
LERNRLTGDSETTSFWLCCGGTALSFGGCGKCVARVREDAWSASDLLSAFECDGSSADLLLAAFDGTSSSASANSRIPTDLCSSPSRLHSQWVPINLVIYRYNYRLAITKV